MSIITTAGVLVPDAQQNPAANCETGFSGRKLTHASWNLLALWFRRVDFSIEHLLCIWRQCFLVYTLSKTTINPIVFLNTRIREHEWNQETHAYEIREHFFTYSKLNYTVQLLSADFLTSLSVTRILRIWPKSWKQKASKATTHFNIWHTSEVFFLMSGVSIMKPISQDTLNLEEMTCRNPWVLQTKKKIWSQWSHPVNHCIIWIVFYAFYTMYCVRYIVIQVIIDTES